MSRSILYYPSMDIKDGVWIRNAMLYWDNFADLRSSRRELCLIKCVKMKSSPLLEAAKKQSM